MEMGMGLEGGLQTNPQLGKMPPSKLPKTAHDTFYYMYSFDKEAFQTITDEQIKKFLHQVFEPKEFSTDVFYAILNKNIISHLETDSGEKIEIKPNQRIIKTKHENKDIDITIPLEGNRKLTIRKTTSI
jgi:hypothetical protein